MLGIGGGGGAPILGIGGGGGAVELGIGGGGGPAELGIDGGSGGAVLPGIGGGGGTSVMGINGGGRGASSTGTFGALSGCGVLGLPGSSLSLSPFFPSSIALSGLGGAIVPNRILARCFADPPAPGRSGPSSSDDEAESSPSLLDSKADQSSSSASCLRREGRGVVETGGGSDWPVVVPLVVKVGD